MNWLKSNGLMIVLIVLAILLLFSGKRDHPIISCHADISGK